MLGTGPGERRATNGHDIWMKLHNSSGPRGNGASGGLCCVPVSVWSVTEYLFAFLENGFRRS